jgi:hypothetical protein
LKTHLSAPACPAGIGAGALFSGGMLNWLLFPRVLARDLEALLQHQYVLVPSLLCSQRLLRCLLSIAVFLLVVAVLLLAADAASAAQVPIPSVLGASDLAGVGGRGLLTWVFVGGCSQGHVKAPRRGTDAAVSAPVPTPNGPQLVLHLPALASPFPRAGRGERKSYTGSRPQSQHACSLQVTNFLHRLWAVRSR